MSVNQSTDANSTQTDTIFNQIHLSAIGLFNILLLTILLLFIIWYLQFWYGRRRLYKYFSKIPKNMLHLPFIGIGHRFSTNTEKMLKTFMDVCENGTPAGMWLAYNPVVFIHRPEDIEIVLNSPKTTSKSRFYRFLNITLGNGLLTAPVSIWKIHRKIIMPTFNQKVLNSFFSVFAKQSEILIEKLKNETGRSMDLTQRLNSWSLDTICETALGLNIDSQNTESLFVQSLHRLMESLTARVVNILYHSNFLYNILAKGAKQAKADNEYVSDFIDQVLQEKYKIFEEKRYIERHDAEITDEKQMMPFLDLFMTLNTNNNMLSDEELRHETATIMTAGSETSATVLGFVSLMLGMFPEVQQKLFIEIVDVIGPERSVVLSDLPEFKYMERVIKETMRIFPVGPFAFRNVDEDLQMNDYLIPKGCNIGIAAIILHRSPEYWRNPLIFDPDRFLPEEVSTRHPYSYIPFLAGPRNCIGMKYAMMSMKTVLAYIVRNYHIQTHYKDVTEIRLKQDVVLKPVDGFPVVLTQRWFD